MATFFSVFFFIALAGLAVGTLIAVKVWYTLPFFFIILIALCFGSFFIGVLLGGALFSWLPLLFTKIVIVLFCIGIAYFFFRQFHPSYGYFSYRGWIHWALLAGFFLLIGIDFANIGLSSWFLLLLLPAFGGMLLVGAFAMANLKSMFRGTPVFIYLPLVLFVFLGLIKLI
ncbi:MULTISPECIES: hypothetical protein [Bacillaceae]|uniref:Uncharacterized protein n=1 Tax=Evansella alkalicola TaxID=745819 RepID=A0ABS6K039_9BACI|nr:MULTISPECIES: hypothetical protein [Bacillaceae]MBU9724209.1 hypothetical protein [Bacillus alkalicola]